MAHAADVIIIKYQVNCDLALTNMDHMWHAPFITCSKPIARPPVAHLGCPMDHIQNFANRSPGDLLMCSVSYNYVLPVCTYTLCQVPIVRQSD